MSTLPTMRVDASTHGNDGLTFAQAQSPARPAQSGP